MAVKPHIVSHEVCYVHLNTSKGNDRFDKKIKIIATHDGKCHKLNSNNTAPTAATSNYNTNTTKYKTFLRQQQQLSKKCQE